MSEFVSPLVTSVMEEAESLPSGHEAWQCAGCNAWQVEITYDIRPAGGGFALDAYLDQVHGANEATQEHRRECPALDMLAALQGVSAEA